MVADLGSNSYQNCVDQHPNYHRQSTLPIPDSDLFTWPAFGFGAEQILTYYLHYTTPRPPMTATLHACFIYYEAVCKRVKSLLLPWWRQVIRMNLTIVWARRLNTSKSAKPKCSIHVKAERPINRYSGPRFECYDLSRHIHEQGCISVITYRLIIWQPWKDNIW